MSWQPFDEFVRSRKVDSGLQTVMYTAHSKTEYQEIMQFLVHKVHRSSVQGPPATVLLGPCIALVNVYVDSVVFDHHNLKFTILFVEAPRTPKRST